MTIYYMYHLRKGSKRFFQSIPPHLPPYEIHRLPPALEDHNLVETHRRPLFVGFATKRNQQTSNMLLTPPL